MFPLSLVTRPVIVTLDKALTVSAKTVIDFPLIESVFTK